MSLTLADEMDRIYREIPPEEIPWVLDEPPRILVELVESGAIQPCKTADIGCGSGNYAVWLADLGYYVTGYDCSAVAIGQARELAEKMELSCRFQVVDLTGVPDLPERSFKFAYHWGVLHHVFPEARPGFARNVARLLQPGGKHLCMCFHESEPMFGGQGKYRETPLGTTLYFSSEDEIRRLFEPDFRILELYVTHVTGKNGDHRAVVGWMERK